MARKAKKPLHKVVMTEGKRQIIQQLLQGYDIETAEEIQGCSQRPAWKYHQRYDGS